MGQSKARRRGAPVTARRPRMRYERTRSRSTPLGRLRADLDELRNKVAGACQGLDALDRGIVEAGLTASHAMSHVDKLLARMEETAAGEFRLDGPGDALQEPDPDTEPPSDEPAFRGDDLPAEHPESMLLELAPADEVMLARYASDMWSRDEYLQITADGQDGGPS